MAAVRDEWQWPVKQHATDLSRLAETPFGTGIAALELQRDRALAKLPKTWAKFSAASPFWR